MSAAKVTRVRSEISFDEITNEIVVKLNVAITYRDGTVCPNFNFEMGRIPLATAGENIAKLGLGLEAENRAEVLALLLGTTGHPAVRAECQKVLDYNSSAEVRNRELMAIASDPDPRD